MPFRWLKSGVWMVCLCCWGCGGPPEIPGGTRGIVHTNDVPLADILIAVYAVGQREQQPVAFAISGSDGMFELREPGTLQALWLPAGEYVFTIEAAGENPLEWPAEFRSREKSPWREAWPGGDQTLDLNLPAPR
jgi:hypothetical protein